AHKGAVARSSWIPGRLRAPVSAAPDRDCDELAHRHRPGGRRLDDDVRNIEGDLAELLAVADQARRDHLPEGADERLELAVGLPQLRWPLDLQERVRPQEAFELRGEHVGQAP